ncbi:unnamed protein product [Paramecium sonneborni]|uniref:Uncharacterized protein n=1 Tax=Paramecium sonneborni TaxID=65129 RepID=A0A8S1PXF3_9CILI|nr:unnamed protein product [Paramecium sonneborni]
MEEDKIKYIIVKVSTQKPNYKINNKFNDDIYYYQTQIKELNEYIKTNLLLDVMLTMLQIILEMLQ